MPSAGCSKGSADVDDRARALEEIVTLARRHGLAAREINEALGDRGPEATGPRGRGVLVRMLGFIGGTFVFAGVGVVEGSDPDAELAETQAKLAAMLGALVRP